MAKKKVCLYLEFYHFLNGFIFKKMGTGSLTSYENQKKMLSGLNIPFVEKYDNTCDIFISNSIWLRSLFLIKKAKKKNKKVIIWGHTTAEDIKNFFRLRYMDKSIINNIIRRYLAYVYGMADYILCPSEYNKNILSKYGFDPQKLIVQSNGVDMNKFCQNPDDRQKVRAKFNLNGTVIGTVGIVIPRKGIDTFLLMSNRFPNCNFVWFGKLFNKLIVSAPDTSQTNVQFTGFIKDEFANGAFNSLDIFFFPSYEENQGMSLLEAAAVGLPILIRDIPTYEGWMEHGVNCLKAKNDEEFVEYISMLIKDAELCDRLGKNALLLAQKHSLDSLKRKLEKITQNG